MVVVALLVARSATAHPVLVSSSPAAGATVVPPAPLILRFNGRIEKKLSLATLVGGPRQTSIALLVSEPATPPEVLVYRLPVLAPGRYEVRWQVLSADGHFGEGVVPFTVSE